MKRHPKPLRSSLLTCLAFAGAGLALADDNNTPADILLTQLDREARQLERQLMVHDGPDALHFVAGERGTERVVKGAPYCAEAVHETVQWLPDGSGGAPNRIVRQQSTLLCRDGEGRTRQEVQRGSRKLVYLRDPVAHESWTLDAERKTARRISLRGEQGPVDTAAWRDYAERMKDWARSVADKTRGHAGPHAAPQPPVTPAAPAALLAPVTPGAPAQSLGAAPPVPPLPPRPVVISRTEGAPLEMEVHVVRMRSADGQAGGEWAPPPAVQWRAQSWAPRGPGTVSPLGIKDIDGLRAHGERTTWVIEAGKVGNEKPIQVTRDVWTAPDLMVTLSSRDFDPRSGEVNYRLKGVKRGEPDPALMRVPADYKTPGRPGGQASGATGQG